MKEVLKFLTDNPTFYIATVETSLEQSSCRIEK